MRHSHETNLVKTNMVWQAQEGGKTILPLVSASRHADLSSGDTSQDNVKRHCQIALVLLAATVPLSDSTDDCVEGRESEDKLPSYLPKLDGSCADYGRLDILLCVVTETNQTNTPHSQVKGHIASIS